MNKPVTEVEEYFNKTTGEYQSERPQKQEDRFVQVPLCWVAAAAALPGKAVPVGLALWHLSWVEGCRSVKLTSTWLAVFHVNRHQKYRALDALAEAGLIRVEGPHGKNPTVTILDAE